MFGLAIDRVWTLLGTTLFVLVIAAYRVYRAKARRRLRTPGIRYYTEPAAQETIGEEIFVCPQCYETSASGGHCTNADHDGTPVRMVKGDVSQLEQYAEMRRLVNPDAD